jgi:O-antigen biosynthesis protein
VATSNPDAISGRRASGCVQRNALHQSVRRRAHLVKSTAVCAIFRDEAPYILEWIAYHSMIGFGHFVLYDNASVDRAAEIVRASPYSQKVTIIDWPQQPGQLAAYQHFCDFFGNRFSWTAFLDLDEFLHIENNMRIADALGNYKDYSSILVQWLMFGPSGYDQTPAGFVIGNYTTRFPDGAESLHHVKSIVRNEKLLGPKDNPHVFYVEGPVCDATCRDVPNEAIQMYECHEKLIINHYFTKSREEWRRKLKKGRADSTESQEQYTDQLFDHVAVLANYVDRRLQRFVPALQAFLRA